MVQLVFTFLLPKSNFLMVRMMRMITAAKADINIATWIRNPLWALTRSFTSPRLSSSNRSTESGSQGWAKTHLSKTLLDVWSACDQSPGTNVCCQSGLTNQYLCCWTFLLCFKCCNCSTMCFSTLGWELEISIFSSGSFCRSKSRVFVPDWWV